ncbi:MAG: SAM-dependent methyltransferase [Myxococcaceae bacterium]|nr:SAM-dependent methyltransferase [Myxococcaceae bacterium]
MKKERRHIHASKVRKELLVNQSTGLLKALHLLTPEGRLNADSLRKLKQVNHLVGLLQPALDAVGSGEKAPVVVDVGSGNAYLGFVLYELFFKAREDGEVYCVESRPELTQRAQSRASQLGFGRMRFQTASIRAAQYPEQMSVLTALHACDTATDDALAIGISRGVEHLAVVPCCQAEVASLLKESRADTGPAWAALISHPMHRREFGSHLTNVIRALVLEAHGYQVTVTELTGWEHSLKNELILARKVGRENRVAQERLDALLGSTGVQPALVRALRPG